MPRSMLAEPPGLEPGLARQLDVLRDSLEQIAPRPDYRRELRVQLVAQAERAARPPAPVLRVAGQHRTRPRTWVTRRMLGAGAAAALAGGGLATAASVSHSHGAAALRQPYPHPLRHRPTRPAPPGCQPTASWARPTTWLPRKRRGRQHFGRTRLSSYCAPASPPLPMPALPCWVRRRQRHKPAAGCLPSTAPSRPALRHWPAAGRRSSPSSARPCLHRSARSSPVLPRPSPASSGPPRGPQHLHR